jgi:hypothetical protein
MSPLRIPERRFRVIGHRLLNSFSAPPKRRLKAVPFADWVISSRLFIRVPLQTRPRSSRVPKFGTGRAIKLIRQNDRANVAFKSRVIKSQSSRGVWCGLRPDV